MLFSFLTPSKSRSTRQSQGVNVLRPRAMRVRQWMQLAVPLCALLGATWGGVNSYQQQRPAYDSGQLSLTAFSGQVAAGAAVNGVAGTLAAYSGGLSYSALGGGFGLALGAAVFTAIGCGGHYAPSVVSSLLQLKQEKQARQALDAARQTEPSRESALASFSNDDAPAMSSDERADQERKRKEYHFNSPPFRGPWNEAILYVGMNKTAAPRAVRRLRQQGARVMLITDAPQQDTMRYRGRVYRLGSKAGIAAFTKSLGLPTAQTREIAAALEACEKQARDELGQLALAWLKAEKGGIIPSRLVLAGHSNGDGVWGDNNGSLRLGPLRLLAQAMPRAARQVEDAFVAGCYSGGEVTMEQYGLILPQVKTIWAYEVQAPGVDNGGAVDQCGWEKATRGRRADVMPPRTALVQKHMAVWSATHGYKALKPPLTMYQLRGKVQWMQQHFFKPAFSGRTTTPLDGYQIPVGINDPQTGLVRQYYSWLCRLTQHPELPEHERVIWNERKHQTIRLIYYSATVAPRFAQHFRGEIRQGYAALGLKPPDYSRLSRGEALREMQLFARKLKQTPNKPKAAVKLQELLQLGLGRLSPQVIVDGWV